jgi:hypothetical protein
MFVSSGLNAKPLLLAKRLTKSSRLFLFNKCW